MGNVDALVPKNPPPPWLHGYVPPPGCPYGVGWVVVRDGWYWTGLPPEAGGAWSRNPRRALVDAMAPWDLNGGLEPGSRCVKVLLEDEATMLPLYRWPPPQ
jgi:hypothetical protein